MELWKSQGTEDTTLLVKNLNSSGNSNPSELTAVGDTVYFAATDGCRGGRKGSYGTLYPARGMFCEKQT